MKNIYKLLYFLSHILFFIYCYFFGIWYLICSLFLALVFFNLSSELFFHRTITHNQFNLNSKATKLFCVLFSMCNYGSIIVNSAIHINHHRFSDTKKDPHDFKNIGLLNVITKNLNKEHFPDKKLIVKFVKNQYIRNQHINHIKYSIISVFLFPFIPVSSFWLINLLFIVSHLGKNDGKDNSINLPILFPLMWGAEMHKDHHLYPNKKKMHRYDIIYYIGKKLEVL